MKNSKQRKIQSYRDSFIRGLDKAPNKTNFVTQQADSLFALGLTMYSGSYSLDSVFYNAFATSELDEHISLHPDQRKILKLIKENQGVIFSAPTSFGKTFVIFEYICREQPQNVVLVVPTLALMDEYRQKIISKYREKFRDYHVHLFIDPETKYNFDEKNLFILTHERLIDESVVNLFSSIDFLVIDEVYKLQKNESDDRVLILNIAYHNIVQKSQKYVLLAPFISGVENTDKLIRQPVFYSSNFSPVVNDVLTKRIVNEKDRNDAVMDILKSLTENESTLIYFPTVVGLDNFITKKLSNTGKVEIVDSAVKKFITWAKAEVHPEWSVIQAIEHGYLVHHGQLPLGMRMWQLSLFNQSDSSFKYLLCTSTLLEGVNTTAKNIIISKPQRSHQKNFDAFDFYNLVGRTGRLYQHYLGMAYYIQGPEDPDYIKENALKSIEFELTTDSVDMGINFEENFQNQDFKKVLARLNIDQKSYKANIANKLRFSTVQGILTEYDEKKKEFLELLYSYVADEKKGKLYLVKFLFQLFEEIDHSTPLKAYILNQLISLRRSSIKSVVEKTKGYYKKESLNSLINRTIKLKSYLEFDFYKKTQLIKFIMQCDHVEQKLVQVIDNQLLKNIEILYYMNEPNKRMIKDMGFYDRDIDKIINVIGNDFNNVGDLVSKIRQHQQKLKGVSFISQFIIQQLSETPI